MIVIGDIVSMTVVGMDDVHDVFMRVTVIGGLDLVVCYDPHKIGWIVRQHFRSGRHDDRNREDEDECVSRK